MSALGESMMSREELPHTIELVSIYRVTLADGRVFEDEDETVATHMALLAEAKDRLGAALSSEWAERAGSNGFVAALLGLSDKPLLRKAVTALMELFDAMQEKKNRGT